MRIVADLDDSIYRTYPYLHGALAERGIRVPYGDYLKPDNTDRQILEILDEGQYMVRVQPALHAINCLRRLHDLGHIIDVCTHRGFHAQGRELTQESFDLHGFDFVNDLHVIDHNSVPNKIEYLISVYGPDFLLLDDRPGFNDALDSPQIVLVDQPWNRDQGGVRIASWEFTEVNSALAMAQALVRGTPHDGNFVK